MRTYLTVALTALALMSASLSAQARPMWGASQNSPTNDVCATGCSGGN
jgi:hypothetical protein